MLSQEDNMIMVQEFLEKGDQRILVIAANQQGQLAPAYTFPPSTKTKVRTWICLHACEAR